MSRLDRLILNEIVGPFVGSVLLFTSLFFAGGDLIRFAKYLQGGAGYLAVGEMILFRFPMVFALTFPMAMLLGTLLGFSRLSADSEMIALIAAGISFRRIVAPVVAFGLLISVVGYWFNQTVVPMSNARGEAIVSDFTKRGGANFESADAFTLPLRDGPNMTLLHVEGGVDTSSLQTGGRQVNLRNISIEEWQHGTATIFFAAERADWIIGTKRWKLRNGTSAYLQSPRTVNSFGSLETDDVVVTLETPEDLADLQLPVEQVTTDRLRRRAAVFQAGGNADQAREAEVEVARRMSLPFASLMFALIGAPLGVSSKRGGKGMGFGLSVVITFCYWTGLQVCSILARGGLLPPLLALMIPNIVCLVVAIFLIRRVFQS